MEEIELADQLGLDVFAVGEHHRPDYAVSSPAVILAAAAVIMQITEVGVEAILVLVVLVATKLPRRVLPQIPD